MHSSHSTLNIHQSDTFKPLAVELNHTINPAAVQYSAGKPRILTFIWMPTGKNYNPSSSVGMRGFTWAEIIFEWVLWVKAHPHQDQLSGFPTRMSTFSMLILLIGTKQLRMMEMLTDLQVFGSGSEYRTSWHFDQMMMKPQRWQLFLRGTWTCVTSILLLYCKHKHIHINTCV